MNQIKPEILEKVNAWLTPSFDTDTQQEIKNLMVNDAKELEESFYKDLEFGTGGMRGIMGIGTNKINKYTLGKNTQGLSNYLKQSFPNKALGVAIAYDCRNNSKKLAKVVADVFSANDITVYLFEDLRPTPELSFAVRHLNCQCGIVLTASHNPPEYNGYKVYWQDGGQLVPPQDHEVISEIENVDYSDINFLPKPDLIKIIGKDVDMEFIKASVANGSFEVPMEVRDNLRIVFTSLHGTSITVLPDTLRAAGFKHIHIVEEQAEPNGNFPTVKSPNPEEPAALKMAMDLAEKVNADIVIGTDPDSDRLGIAVRNLEGELVLLNGNQTMIVMTDFLLNQWREAKKINGKQFIASTIVSTPMMKKLAEKYFVEYKEALTGFKWIAKMIVDFPKQEFIGGGEESFGYMVGDFVRDKDAVTSTLLACEIAAISKANKCSFYGELLKLYRKHGLYKEHLVSLTKKGISGAEEIKQMMVDARENPIRSVKDIKVESIEDYAISKKTFLESGRTEKIDIPKSNVIIYNLEDGSRIALRPSGTEPKIKFYMSVNAPLESLSDMQKVSDLLDAKIASISEVMGLS
ncbi:phospho-sugar mutase [Aegicerativicinus sediminis]|uniref:phospho-sugar mutase n=1 Tax=Aegicerativicinus sediminis TaxID=2893202 RepID=UPI001E452A51|nr:phospho-sugar mutase [Aegicerativicinus sediminis]